VAQDKQQDQVRHPLGALLRWYVDVGVDETVGEEPVCRYRLAAEDEPRAAPNVSPRGQHSLHRSHALAVDEALAADEALAVDEAPTPAAVSVANGATAAEIAAACTTLDDLVAALAHYEGCPLRTPDTRLVFGDGNPEADIVLIGEAPGAEEDRLGKPFVGQSGRLLDRMLASIGLDRSRVFISNTVFWRPPANRVPTKAETAACQPFVERLIEIISPRLLIAVGGPAAAVLLGQTDSIGRLRGRWFDWQTPRMARPAAATAIYHPAYLLRSPGQKRLAWRDLLAIKRKIEEIKS
jgi:uracil-DNA glycosylase family 4